MPVREVVADTAGWASYFVRSQPFHSPAGELLVHAQAGNLRVITTNYASEEPDLRVA